MNSIRLSLLKFMLRHRLQYRIRGGWRLASILAKPFRSLPVASTPHGPPVYLNIQSLDEHAVSLLLWSSSYHEAGEQQLLRRIIHEGDTVYDIGANLGLFTLLFSSAVGPGGHVIAIEPNPALTGNLAKTIEPLPRVQLHCCALASEPGSAIFYIPKDDHMLASLANWSGQRVNEVTIPVDTLDHIVDQHPPPALVKIDVEGAEDLVLQGASRMLASPTPPIIFFEQIPSAAAAFGYAPCSAQRRVAETGRFKFYRILPNGELEQLDKEYEGSANFLAVPEHLASRIA
jgi:FkbM family methyltransferase